MGVYLLGQHCKHLNRFRLMTKVSRHQSERSATGSSTDFSLSALLFCRQETLILVLCHYLSNTHAMLSPTVDSMQQNPLKALAVVFFSSGIWDFIAAMLYFFVIGTGRLIDRPAIDPFFAVFLGSFFLCFAWLQFLSAFNVRQYAFNIGCLILGRSFYVVLLYAYMLFSTGFPFTFWFTGIIDGSFTVLYLYLARKGGLSMGDLFLPNLERETQN